jgi:arylsulfatase A-like enzyme
MKRKTPFPKAPLLSFFLLAATFAFAQTKEQKRPNVIFIYADDMGYGDLSCYGSDSIHTPHLDELAAKGIRYTDFYSTSPICSPSRAGLLTGQYPIRNGIGPVFFPWSKGGLDTATFTMAELFKAQGYATACIGKWHPGHQPQYHPSQHGFDYFFGLRYSNDMDWPRPWKPDYEPKQLLALYRDTTIIDQPVHQPTLTQRYTAEAIQFVAQHQDKPFFLYWPHTFPHEPLFVSAEFQGTSKYGLYGDVVQELDNSVGQLMQALEDFGLSENTIIVFSSDNGARQVPQRWGNKESCGSNAPLRGRKSTTFDGGIRVPTIAYGKGYFEGGIVESTPGIMCDWLPTFAAITDYELPDELKLNGTDLLTLKPTNERDFFFYRIDKLNAIRSGPWKLKLANPGRARGEPIPHDEDLLFNLVQDPGEQHNLASKYPEKVTELKARMAAFEASIAPLPPLQK